MNNFKKATIFTSIIFLSTSVLAKYILVEDNQDLMRVQNNLHAGNSLAYISVTDNIKNLEKGKYILASVSQEAAEKRTIRLAKEREYGKPVFEVFKSKQGHEELNLGDLMKQQTALIEEQTLLSGLYAELTGQYISETINPLLASNHSINTSNANDKELEKIELQLKENKDEQEKISNAIDEYRTAYYSGQKELLKKYKKYENEEIAALRKQGHKVSITKDGGISISYRDKAHITKEEMIEGERLAATQIASTLSKYKQISDSFVINYVDAFNDESSLETNLSLPLIKVPAPFSYVHPIDFGNNHPEYKRLRKVEGLSDDYGASSWKSESGKFKNNLWSMAENAGVFSGNQLQSASYVAYRVTDKRIQSALRKEKSFYLKPLSHTQKIEAKTLNKNITWKAPSQEKIEIQKPLTPSKESLAAPAEIASDENKVGSSVVNKITNFFGF